MGGPRDYSVGTQRALFSLSNGTCAAPGCETRNLINAGGKWLTGVQIAHIRGAEPNSARYDATMTDDERADFPNLLLLCQAHHTLVDRTAPADHPRELLEEWKTDNESGQGLPTGLSGAELDALFADIRRSLEVSRERTAEVQLLCGVEAAGGLETVPINDMALLGEVAAFDHLPRILIAKIRNVGHVPVTVESVDLRVLVGSQYAVLQGRDDGLPTQPLPARVEDGDAYHWMIYLASVVTVAKAGDLKMTGFQVAAHLATGETLESDVVTSSTLNRTAGAS